MVQVTTKTIGCCGIDCGLCPRFYTAGVSRCPGCGGENFEKLHPQCGFLNCCTKRGIEACAMCCDFPCAKFARETGETDSFVTHRKVIPNQLFIREKGIAEFKRCQEQRILLLEKMLNYWDDGRSKSFYCTAAALLSVEGLGKALDKAEKSDINYDNSENNKKDLAKVLKNHLNQVAAAENVELKLRKSSLG